MPIFDYVVISTLLDNYWMRLSGSSFLKTYAHQYATLKKANNNGNTIRAMTSILLDLDGNRDNQVFVHDAVLRMPKCNGHAGSSPLVESNPTVLFRAYAHTHVHISKAFQKQKFMQKIPWYFIITYQCHYWLIRIWSSWISGRFLLSN